MITKIDIPEWKGKKHWKLLYPFALVMILLALTLMTAVPVSAATPTIPVAISLSNYNLSATANYTIYLRLGTDWGPNDWLQIQSPYYFHNFSLGSPPIQYISDDTGPHNLADGWGQSFIQDGSAAGDLIITGSGVQTIPAGSTLIIKINITNPSSAGTYTFNLYIRDPGSGPSTDPTLGAIKDSGSYTLTLPESTPPPPSLTLNVSGSGSISAFNPYTYDTIQQGSCPSGTIAELMPVAASGWYFDHWEGDLTGWQNIPGTDILQTIYVVGPTTATAVFKNTVNEDVSCTTGGGTVSPGSGDYAFGSTVTFTATPSPGWHFVKWIDNGSDASGYPSLSIGESYCMDVPMTPLLESNNTVVDSNFSLFAVFAQNVSKTDPTLTITNSPVTYNGSPQTATVEGSVAGTVSNVEYNGSATVPTSAGTYAVTADFVPTDTTDYNSLIGVSAGNFVINKATPTITWSTPADIVYGTALSSTQLDATASVPGSFAYSPDTGAILNAGAGQTLSVTFTPADPTDYDTDPASVTINVEKADATVTLGDLNQTYDGTPESVTATTSPAGLTVNITYDGLAAAPTDAGSYAVVATVQDTNYQGSASGTLVIARANQTITFGALTNKTYGAPDFTVRATASSGLPVSFTASGACTISGDMVHITGAGDCTITAQQAGDNNYNAAPDVSQSFNVIYKFSGFLSPLNKKTYNLGSSIPIKWQLTDCNGNFINNLTAVKSLLVGPEGGALSAPASNGKTELRYNTTSNQYIFNWQTKGLKAGDYTISLSLNDGAPSYTMTITLK